MPCIYLNGKKYSGSGKKGKDGSSITNIEIRDVGTEQHLFCTIADSDGNEQELDAGILQDSGTTAIEISKADYLLLTEEERKDKVYYIYDDDENNGQILKYSDTRPTTADAKMGDIVFNSIPEPSGFVGWVFTAFGWLGFGVIEATKAVEFILNDNTTFMVDDGTGTGNGTPFLYRDSII